MTLVRTKTSEAVADHILGLLFDGTLRTGDRIDIDGIATTLGVSRVPVREGLMSLERDGLVRMPHYRGAFVAGFDAATVFEAFELYGMLSALTNRRAAAKGDPGVLESLEKLDDALQRASTVDEFERLAREFRRVVNVSSAGNHLRALLRTFSGLVPAAARFAIETQLQDVRAAQRVEFDALRAGDPEAAGRAALDHIDMTATNAVAALRRRGVFPPDEPDEPDETEPGG
ncbi:GntR family transcriptional regulator [Virgisporangium ochraceum]